MLFHNLLLTTTGEGGLHLLHENQCYQLDSLGSTGISEHDGLLLRAVQPGTIIIYGHNHQQNIQIHGTTSTTYSAKMTESG